MEKGNLALIPGGGKLEASRDKVRKGSDGIIIFLNAAEEVVVFFAVGFDDLFVMAGVGPHTERGGVLASRQK